MPPSGPRLPTWLRGPSVQYRVTGREFLNNPCSDGAHPT
jgi:hypothetical protein